ncbi:MAG: Asp-tRNA(Asn)/Glu-tRNA(Gln) amidotransferase subunit GatB [Lachnospiraceae bacterium]|nr:Asp-tRNA(Asn)/Glu-tRNA(Gln) amidotransferase subunit GatB [Lachnospiraceae bacterium]
MANVYETVIGLEVHVELSTKTKIFCGCSTAFGGKPNTRVCPVCSGMPGTLPVFNEAVLDHAISLGLATHSEIAKEVLFDRKNYFYPDNPQNYQISQLYHPICQNGYVEIRTGEETQAPLVKRIRIHDIHMEEDAGKLFHDEDGRTSLVDFNRSGVPLLEIVSEPDLAGAEEVKAYLEELRTIIRYLGISDCKLQEGSMRADVNLSIRPLGQKELGTRTEMKNLNSFRAITHAIEAESVRQKEILEGGGEVIMETRRWDEEKGTSFSMRSKEDTRDYRYFPEPDLPPVTVSKERIERLERSLPEMRPEKIERFVKEYGLPVKDVLNLTKEREFAQLFEDAAGLCKNPKKVSNWLLTDTLRLMRERGVDADKLRFSPAHLADLVNLTTAGRINSTVASAVFEKLFEEDIDPVAYVRSMGLEIVTDDKKLRESVLKILSENKEAVADYQAGKQKAIGFLVGQTMKAEGGKADPNLVRKLLVECLEELA